MLVSLLVIDIRMQLMLRSEFVRHVATLMSGKAASQIISVLAVPIVARLFNPDDFGVMAIYLSIVIILSGVGPLRYFRAGLIEKDDRNAHYLYLISFISLIITCILVIGLISIFLRFDVPIPYYDTLGSWIWLVPAGMLIVGSSQILSTANIRLRQFKSVAAADITNASVTALVRILIGQAGSSVWGLMTGYFAGMLSQAIILLKKLGFPAQIDGYVPPDKKDLRRLAVKYRDFPLYNMPTSLMTNLSQNLPVLMLGLIYAPEVVGFYAMADRLVRRPLGVMNKPLQDVFMVKGAQIVNENQSLLRPFMKVTFGLFLLGVMPFTLLMIYGEQLLGFILGGKWSSAGIYVEILAPWYFSTWVIICIRPVMTLHRIQGRWLVIQIITLIIRASIFAYALVYGMDILNTLSIFTKVNIAIAILLLIYALYVIKQKIPEY